MIKLINKVIASRDGATAIEYGLIAGFVAIAIVSALTTTGTDLTTLFTNVNTKLTAAAG
jgi:pilus assembly protein Flp/PilA